MMKIKENQVFDTDFEEYCIVTSEPDTFGNFTALDSDGVECEFNVKMVKNLRNE